MPEEVTREDTYIALTGMLLTFTGLFCLFFDELLEPEGVEEWGTTLCYCTIIVGGAFLMLRYRIGYENCITTVGITLGVSLILCNLSIDPVNDPLFILKFIDICLGTLLIVLSATYMLGFRYNILQITRILLFLIAFDMVPIVLEWYVGIPMIDTFTYYLSTVPLVASYIAVIAILSSKGIRVIPPKTKLMEGIDTLMDVAYTDGAGYITPIDLATLMYPEESGWRELMDGPVCREVTLHLWQGVEKIPFSARQYRDDGHVSLEFDSGGKDRVSSHLRFDINHTELSEDGDRVTLYNTNGFFIVLMIDDVRLGDSAVTNAYRVLSNSDLNKYRRE